jgi:hypothetical protein
VKVQELWLEGSNSSACKTCVQDECRCMQQNDYDSHEDKCRFESLQKRACDTSDSPPQSGNKGECSRYKSAFNSVAILIMSNIINLQVTMEKYHVHFVVSITIVFQSVGRESPFSGNFPSKGNMRRKCKRFAAIVREEVIIIDHCWTLHPTSHPRHKKHLGENIDKNGRGDSILEVRQDDSTRRPISA